MTGSDDQDRGGKPLNEDQDGPLGKHGWHAGATFFEESGGRPAEASASTSDSLPASEAGTGIIPEDDGGDGGDTHLPASEADDASLQQDEGGEPQSWPGKSFGSIPPPG